MTGNFENERECDKAAQLVQAKLGALSALLLRSFLLQIELR